MPRSTRCSPVDSRRWPISSACRSSTQIVTESMRLYPPAWIIGRRAIGEYTLGPYTLPPARDDFHEPVRDAARCPILPRSRPFRPSAAGRAAAAAALPKFAYFPFGGGARQCIGEHFAWMELDPARGHIRSAVAAPVGAESPGCPAAADHAAGEARHGHDAGPPDRRSRRSWTLAPRRHSPGMIRRSPRRRRAVDRDEA